MERLLRNRVEELNGMDARRTAIIGIHWQEDVVGGGDMRDIFRAYVESSNIIPRTAGVFDAARKAGVLVVFVNAAFWPNYAGLIQNNGLFRTVTERNNAFIRGSRGVAVVPEFGPAKSDIIIEHSRMSVFHGSDLQSILIGHGIDTVALTGVATNVAVDHSVRDAAQLGYRTLLIEDCCCSSDPSYHEASLKSLRVIATSILTSDVFLQQLTAQQASDAAV
ncbi:cysteine hydrolase [Bradyrhizobium sp. NP1]|uniref:cysteine hydrolase family protein n=1 Tax=Bradyrhizobium sp. NP1 TaxID=3049772 RepID=UPI0025A5C80E|nr:cysteine hydrolase [Bradyrhizobium sp. NP1]WJR76884.1 cysteine hydrolase [Bradyrhizobium sp. NP1]